MPVNLTLSEFSHDSNSLFCSFPNVFVIVRGITELSAVAKIVEHEGDPPPQPTFSPV